MGRLTLNVLLSFAQFEREVTGERIRDKIAASKKKGMWMGGVAPLGYDVRDRQLIINPTEAKVVGEIFTQYLSLGSVAALKQYLDRKKLRTKVHTSAHGRVFGGQAYSRGGLYKLLNNEVYTGRIAHRGELHAGQQQAIIGPEVWEKVKALLAANNQGHRQRGRRVTPSVLAGLVFDAEGNRLHADACGQEGQTLPVLHLTGGDSETTEAISSGPDTGEGAGAAGLLATSIAPKLTPGDGRGLYRVGAAD
jgi:hypothetical protein